MNKIVSEPDIAVAVTFGLIAAISICWLSLLARGISWAANALAAAF